MAALICDSREQKWDHVRNYLDRENILWKRSKLMVGDYARVDTMSTIVDRKAHMTEVEGNLIQQHDRFRRECELAKECGIHLVVLIENNELRMLEDVKAWVNPRLTRWQQIDAAHARGRMLNVKISPRPPVDGTRLYRIMETMSEKYGVEWRFCPHQCAGEEICRILGVLPMT